MMDTDETYDNIVEWIEEHKLHFSYDKWGTGSIIIPKQYGFLVECDIGFWSGIEFCKFVPIKVFDVELLTPQT